MKKIIVLFIILSSGINLKLYAQEQEIQQLLLNLEKLAQLKEILSNMKEGYQILSAGYNTIEDLSQGNFNLHKTFLDGLLQVNPEIKDYQKIAEIIQYQLMLVSEHKFAYDRFHGNGNFTPRELDYIERVYDNLFRQSLSRLDELTVIITAGELRMSDDERLQAIDGIHMDMQDKLLFLRHFNNSTTVLALQREKARNDVTTIKEIRGLNY